MSALLVGPLGMAGCSRVDQTVAPGAFPEESVTSAQSLRGIDDNANGVRDEIDAAIAGMGKSDTDRARLLAFAWSLQNSIELPRDAETSQAQALAQYIANASGCLMEGDSLEAFNGLVDVRNLSLNTPARVSAMQFFDARVQMLGIVPAEAPCVALAAQARSAAQLPASAAAPAAAAASVPAQGR